MPCSFLIKTESAEKYELIVYPECDGAKPHEVVIDYYTKLENKEENIFVVYQTRSMFLL